MSLKTKKTTLIGFALLGALMMVMITSATAAGMPDEMLGVGISQATRHVNAGDVQAFQFRAQNRNSVRLQFNATSDLTINMDVDVDAIGDKSVAIDLDCATACVLNMTCKETSAELGLQNGNAVQTRSQNRYSYQYGFMANISCNCTTFNARLRAQVGNLNGYVWAFWNETASAWEEVPTITVDGEAIAEVDHFSTWTLLAPETSIGLETAGILALAALAAGIMAVLVRKRKMFQ
jgi:hypothetical protein